MKTILKVIAWTGLGFMALGVAMSFYIWMALIFRTPQKYPGMGPEFGWVIIIPIQYLGLLLMYIGGLITRPKRLWIASISIGVLHILVSVPPVWRFLVRRISEQGTNGLLRNINSEFILPGLQAILLGILLLIIDKLSKKRKQKEV